MQNLQQQMGAESQLQSLPPAVQKAIFLHLTQQQQQQQESHPQGNEPQRAEVQDDNSNRGKSKEQENLESIQKWSMDWSKKTSMTQENNQKPQ